MLRWYTTSRMAEYESKKAADLVSRLVDSFGGTDEYGVVPFVRRWSEIVGADIAAHSRVVDIRNGALLVGLDHPAWVQRLHMQKTQVLRTINRRFPEIPVRYLHFVVVDDLQRDQYRSFDEENPSEPSTQDERVKPPEPDLQATPEDDEGRGSATEDEDFQRHLESLRRAIEARDSD